MANGDKFKFVGSIVAGILAIVVIIYNLVYSPLNSAISKEADARVTDNKEIYTDIKQGDDCNRDDFLKAIRELTAEQKQDNKEIMEKLGVLTIEIAVIKKEIQK